MDIPLYIYKKIVIYRVININNYIMNPNNPDIDDLLKSFKNGKRKHNEIVIDSDEIVTDLKIICIDRLKLDLLKRKLNYRELTNYLNEIEFTLAAVKLSLENDNSTNMLGKTSFIAMVTVHLQLITEMKDVMIKKTKNFNPITFLNEARKKLIVEAKNQSSKKKKISLEYEDDSENETTDEESSEEKPKKKLKKKVKKDDSTEEEDDDEKPKKKNTKVKDDGKDKKKNTKDKKKPKVEEMIDDDDDDDDDDSDDDDDDEEEEEEEEEEWRTFNNKELLNNKMGKEFIEQLYRGKGGNDLEDETLKYFTALNKKDRKSALGNLKDINNFQNSEKPILFQIMALSLPMAQKNHILKNYLQIATSRYENNKLKSWVDNVMQIPFDKFMGTNLTTIKNDKVKGFLDGLQKSMDDAAWGHEEAKRQIIQMMGQQIKNPKSKGNMLGIYGPPGNGKTTLIKEGIAKAMDKPFIFISLGGATDSSFLEGHSYTYEGSIYGRIVNGLITSKCMDPIIYFDELDKISKTPKGDEITNILVHLTDPVQNNHFRDKYFHGIDIDLSRATMIFSYNDPSNVNPILLDRITTVETKYLLISQKIHIAKNYLLPEMFKEMNFQEDAVVFTDDLLREIINKYTHEGGVRKLKSILYNIVREINLSNLLHTRIDDKVVVFPFTVKASHLKLFLKHKFEVDPDKIHDKPKCGIVNGLYAGSMGVGGVLPIEVVWIPAQNPLQLKATGHLEKVIKESTEVACSLAWNYLGDKEKDKFQEFWKTKPMGFHIHCPEGAVPKDGPSAGAALTLALYSLLTNRKIRNNVAMTGEINLQGQVMPIGGLEEKLEGAKRTGVNLALIPKDNKKHLDKIIERNTSLFDSTFRVEIIECFDDVVKHALLPFSSTDTPMIKGLFKDTDMDELDLTKQNTITNTVSNLNPNPVSNPVPNLNPNVTNGENSILKKKIHK
jgi:endopeptidase La